MTEHKEILLESVSQAEQEATTGKISPHVLGKGHDVTKTLARGQVV